MQRLGILIASTGMALALGVAAASAADLVYDQRTYREEAYVPPVRERIIRERIIIERPVEERVIVRRPVEERVIVRKSAPPLVAFDEDEDDYPVYAHRPWRAPGWHRGGWHRRDWGYRGFHHGALHRW